MRFLIGLFLIIILSPLTVWFAESQHRAKDFSSATQVEATQLQDGYVVTSAVTNPDEGVACPVGGPASCLYVSTLIEEYLPVEEVVCRDEAPSGVKILRSEDPQCDEYGDCEPCWLVEDEKWVPLDDIVDHETFTVGAYTVSGDESVNYIGTSEYYEEQPSSLRTDANETIDELNPVVGDIREYYEYIQLGPEILVAGDALNGEIESAEKEFVISTLDYDGTAEALKTQDRNTSMGLRIFSAMLMMIGFMFLVSPFLSVTGAFANLIPVFGKAAHGPFKAGVYALAGLAGLLVWFVVWISVLFLKNLWWISILGIVILLVILAKEFIKKKKQPSNKLK